MTIKSINLKAVAVLALAVILCGTGYGQTAGMTSVTTINADVSATTTTIPLASTTNVLAQQAQGNLGGVGSPTGGPNYTFLFIEGEAMRVTSLIGTTAARVMRGVEGTTAKAHKNGALVYVGSPSSVVIGNNGGTEFWLPAGNCNSSVSGNGTGTNGLTTATTSLMPVVQAQTSATGTNTHTFVCVINPPNNLLTQGMWMTDVEFFYGVQTTALGTQVATLASGTMNSQLVFSRIVMPAPGASETSSVAAPVRADSGTLTINPAVASFNVATTTAGRFFSAKFTPQYPIYMGLDNQVMLFSVALLNTATSATITNSPGALVHFVRTPAL